MTTSTSTGTPSYKDAVLVRVPGTGTASYTNIHP
eukprot:CAMPEP_0168218900 /NCGR_PEP_ID=MMETSP0140_2-20121125/8207_1 /TAXON_ID=44445 /ORGANISM="Pseudo-nitzschia australis, Strain 10249 10 AB" /LENGTH=33 /DNA_ID= /DNA_START= /DNA_END= /DNA_ORIENTATION=